MPPEVKEIVPPATRGLECIDWLEHHGLVAQQPDIRASDLDGFDSDAFGYYLTRRLGIQPAMSFSQALRSGTWFHAAAEYVQFSKAERRIRFNHLLEERIKELKAIAKELEYGEERTQFMLDREKKTAYEALAWFEACDKFRPFGNQALGGGLHAYLTKQAFVTLGTEVVLKYRPRMPFIKQGYPFCVCQIDRLVWTPATKMIWFIDYKTCSGPTIERLQVCPIEFATRHYLSIGRWLLNRGYFQKTYGLPDDVKLGGMIHVAVKKPGFEFCSVDRPYRYFSEGKRSKVTGTCTLEQGLWVFQAMNTVTMLSGPLLKFKDEEEARVALHNATGKEPEKQYFGEPRYELYEGRCEAFYTGNEHGEDWPVNISTSPTELVLDEDSRFEYISQLKRLYSAATRKPIPRSFDRKKGGMTRINGQLTPLADFYSRSPADWPSIFVEGRFIQRFREEEVAHVTESC